METYIGRITKDAIKRDVSGKTVINFTIAKNRRYKQGDEIKERTTYIECAYWNVPGVHPYLVKGTLVEVSGDTGARAYNNSEGKAVAALTLAVRELHLHASSFKNETTAPPREEPEMPEGDDLPF